MEKKKKKKKKKKVEPFRRIVALESVFCEHLQKKKKGRKDVCQHEIDIHVTLLSKKQMTMINMSNDNILWDDTLELIKPAIDFLSSLLFRENMGQSAIGSYGRARRLVCDFARVRRCGRGHTRVVLRML